MVNKKRAAEGLIGLVLFAITILALATFAHCAVGKQQPNSLGTVQYTTNPLMYLAANLAPNQDALTIIDGNLNLRVKPLGTYMLYDEPILFCGTPLDKFRGIGEPFVLTFERRAHKTVQGVACHNLIRVDNVVERQEEIK
jgi:hypothetical protein